jgi:hypothetical protein
MKSLVSPSLMSLMLAVALPACVPAPKPEYNITTTVRPSPPEIQGGGPDFDAAVDLAVGEDGSSAPDLAEDAPGVELEVPGEKIAPPPGSGALGTGGAGGSTALVPSASDALIADASDVAPTASVDARPARDVATVDGVVMAKTCADVHCPALFDVARQCNAHGSECRRENASAPGADTTITRYCHANGVKKIATGSYSNRVWRTSLQVMAANGRNCYELDMSTMEGTNVEQWLFRLTSGEVLARGSWNSVTGRSYLTCEGVTYDVSATDCPGTDGEPGPGECARGTCR